MRLLYLSQSYVPSRRADSVQVMRMCAAFAGRGHQVELVSKACAARQEPGVIDEHDFYGVARSFGITKLPRPAVRGGGALYSLAVATHLLRRRRDVDLVFSRELWGAWTATRLRLPVRFECHGVPRGALARQLFRSFTRAATFEGLVVITNALLQDLRRQGLHAGDKAIVAPDAADLVPTTAAEGSEPSISLRRERFNAGYVGHLYPGRGVEVIVELAARLPEVDFHLVGGHDEAVASWRARSRSPNLLFHGFRQPSELARIYPHFDVLLMPYQRNVGVQSGRSDTSRWMSPMKLFEYMAAGQPIISSDLTVLREVLEDGQNALLVPPDGIDDWERAIRRLLADRAFASRLGQAAAHDLELRYTWKTRARRVLDEL